MFRSLLVGTALSLAHAKKFDLSGLSFPGEPAKTSTLGTPSKGEFEDWIGWPLKYAIQPAPVTECLNSKHKDSNPLDDDVCEGDFEMITEEQGRGDCGESEDNPCPARITTDNADKWKCSEVKRIPFNKGGKMWIKGVIVEVVEIDEPLFQNIPLIRVVGAKFDQFCENPGEEWTESKTAMGFFPRCGAKEDDRYTNGRDDTGLMCALYPGVDALRAYPYPNGYNKLYLSGTIGYSFSLLVFGFSFFLL